MKPVVSSSLCDCHFQDFFAPTFFVVNIHVEKLGTVLGYRAVYSSAFIERLLDRYQKWPGGNQVETRKFLKG